MISRLDAVLYNPKSKIEMPPARLERATHSLAYLTWFPKPHFLVKTVESLDYILGVSAWVRVVSTAPLCNLRQN